MIKVENVQMWGIEHAVRAVRNPMSSWDKSDSGYQASGEHHEHIDFVLGEEDLGLMRKLTKAGVEHRTYARLIQVCMDITAPLYWWKEMDRYCVGKSQISTSTMHTIHKKEFTLDDFSCEHLLDDWRRKEELWVFNDEYGNTSRDLLEITTDVLNQFRDLYLKTNDKRYWWQMIQLLPSSYNQKRTILMSYEVAFKIIRERTWHKLDEWRSFCDELKRLPYMSELLVTLQ